MTPPRLRAVDLSPRYEFLDALPARLKEYVIANLHGALQSRVPAVLRLREALLDGRTPLASELEWPDGEFRESLLGGLEQSGVARFCKGEHELTEAVLLTVLDVVDEAEQTRQRMILSFIELASAEESARRHRELHGEG